MRVLFGLVFAAVLFCGGMTQEARGMSDELKTALQSESYIYVATQRRNGEWSAAAPVWFMYDDDAIYFTTAPGSHKARRIARGAAVRLWVGRKDGPLLEGDVQLVTDLAIVERMGERYKQKYWIAWLGFFRPRPGRVAEGKTLAVKVAPLRAVQHP